MLRSVMPMISAACIHVISPPIARVITSLIFIVRSKARIGYNGIHSQPPIWTRTYSDPVPRPDISFATSTGQIMCYRQGRQGLFGSCLMSMLKAYPAASAIGSGCLFEATTLKGLSMKYNVLIFDASYGSLFSTKLLMAVHGVSLVC